MKHLNSFIKATATFVKLERLLQKCVHAATMICFPSSEEFQLLFPLTDHWLWNNSYSGYHLRYITIHQMLLYCKAISHADWKFLNYGLNREDSRLEKVDLLYKESLYQIYKTPLWISLPSPAEEIIPLEFWDFILLCFVQQAVTQNWIYLYKAVIKKKHIFIMIYSLHQGQ